MSTYLVTKVGDILYVKFGTPAQNDQIVVDALNQLMVLDQMGELGGGHIIKINGPASLPVAVVIAHYVAHRYEVVAVFDPKLNAYVVSVSHHPSILPGMLLQ